MRRRDSLVKRDGAKHHGEALPFAIWPWTTRHVRVEHAVLAESLGDEPHVGVGDVVGHVYQHHERPSEVERGAGLDLHRIRRVDEVGLLVLEPALAQFLASLLEDLGTYLDARVV